MRNRPTFLTVVGALAISVQAALAAPCGDDPVDALAGIDVDNIYNRVERDPRAPCLGDRLRAAVEAVIPEIAALARRRGLPCSARCWLDRPTSAIARVDGHIDPIWPRPPDAGRGDLVFIICVPDLTEGWWWVFVSEPDAAGRVEVEVRRE